MSPPRLAARERSIVGRHNGKSLAKPVAGIRNTPPSEMARSSRISGADAKLLFARRGGIRLRRPEPGQSLVARWMLRDTVVRLLRLPLLVRHPRRTARERQPRGRNQTA